MSEEPSNAVVQPTDALETLEVNPVEQEARSQGWVDKDEFRGSETDWVDAETFVRRGKEIMPVLRKNNEKLLQRLAKAEKDAEEARNVAKEFQKFQKENYERKVQDYEAQLSQLKQAKKEAISVGDGDRAVAIDDQIDDIKEQRDIAKLEANRPEPQVQATTTADPALNTWLEKNSWFGTDLKKTGIANGLGEAIRRENPGLVGKEFLDKLDEEMNALLGQPVQRQAPQNPVEGRSNTRPSGTKRQSYDNLPAEAKAACDRFVKQGLMTKEQYVAEYSWD
ncbi:hypothetical protein [Caudoviricetes sp.]|nr:hypothetical protein [Caudoviricetes sp.]